MTTLAILLLQIVSLAVLALAYHKLSGAVAAQRQAAIAMADNTFRQIEALMGLYAELGLRHALPPTRGWAASPDFLRNLVMYVLGNSPCTVVECSSGVSTIVLARCMEIVGRGHVYSLENSAEFVTKTQALLRLHGLERFASVLHAPLVPISLVGWSGQWYSHDVLPKELRIDLLVVDGPPSFVSEMARYPAIPVLHGRINPLAAVFLDDADREAEKVTVKRWLGEFTDLSRMEVPRCEKGCAALIKQLNK